MKTQFLVEFDGVRQCILFIESFLRVLQIASNDSERVLVIGATNRPFDLDDAVIRCVVLIGLGRSWREMQEI